MVRGIFGSHKGRLICLGIVLWLAMSILFITANSAVFFKGLISGKLYIKDIDQDNFSTNQPINGRINNVTANVTDYYTEDIPDFKDKSISEYHNIYIVPIDNKGSNVLLTVIKGSETDIKLASLLNTEENDNRSSEISKTGVWINATGFIPKQNMTAIAQDRINLSGKNDIIVYNYIIDCSHPYSGFVFRFSFGITLLIILFIAIFIIIKRAKAVVMADEYTVRESYIAANRRPPEEQQSTTQDYNPAVRTDNDDGKYSTTRVFDSSTRNVDHYNSREISYGQFQRQGEKSGDDGFFGE